MNVYYTCIIIAVQLITQSMPISSSGHVFLACSLISLFTGTRLLVSDSFNALMHGPTSFVTALFFAPRWFLLMSHPWRCRFIIARLSLLGSAALIPTVLFYAFFKLYYDVQIPLWVGFGITGLLLFSLLFVNRVHQTKTTRIAYWQACLLGCAQGVALLPGISRLGSTVVIGQWLGLYPKTAFMFSCMIEWPLITAAFVRELYVSPLMTRTLYCSLPVALCVCICSVLSYIVLGFVFETSQRQMLWKYAFYMIIPMVLAFVLYY